MKTKKPAELVMRVDVNGRLFVFPTDLFALDKINVAHLNRQIGRIPADIALVGTALGEAERHFRELETEFEVWLAEKTNNYDDLKTEQAKQRQVRFHLKKQYVEFEKRIGDAAYIVRLLKSYREAVDAKHQLSQTISANLRAEKGAWNSGRSE